MDAIKSELEEISKLCNSVRIENTELEKEINALLHAADDVVLLLYSRRCLEVIITEICETMLNRERGSEPMKGIIDKFYKEKTVPEFMHTAMQNLNNNSVYGAHPKEFDKRQVRTTLIDLATILEWYFFDLKKFEKTIPKTETKKEPKVVIADQESVTDTNVVSKKNILKPVFIIIAVAAILVAGYFILGKKPVTKDEKTVQNVIDTVKQSGKSRKDSVPLTTNKNTELKKQPLVEKKTQPTGSTATPLDLPEDLEGALNMLKDKTRFYGSRKASIPVLLKRFITNARVDLLNKSDICVETYAIKDYLEWVVGSGIYYKQIELFAKETDGNKIKAIKVKHIK